MDSRILTATVLLLSGCRSEPHVVEDSAHVKPAAQVEAGPSLAEVPPDAGASSSPAAPDVVPWIAFGSSGFSDDDTPPHRTGGVLVQPRIELPANGNPDGGTWSFEDAVNEDFPLVHFRVHGLPAVSRDGTRVAYVYSPVACCRFTYPDPALTIVDVATGNVLKRLPLVSASDELYIPQRDGTGARGTRGAPGVSRALTEDAFHVNAASFEKIIASRARAANAELAGEWTTLASIDRDQAVADEVYKDSGKSVLAYRGEGIAFTVEFAGNFPPFDIHGGDGHVTRVTTSAWKMPLPSYCPPDRYTLTLGRVFGSRGKFLLVEAREDDGPDGCETSSMRVVRL